MPENTTTLDYVITDSVGRPSKGATNKSADVQTVQSMFRIAAMIESEPRFDPGGIDGAIDPNESIDDTISAIEAFQSRFFAPDGVINVGKRTWRELIDLLDGDDEEADTSTIPDSNTVVTNGECFFPFTRLPDVNWTGGFRRFGASRDDGARVHAGCDLYFPVGTTIHAITSGTVTRGPYAFYDGTWALEIDHGAFLARYGEVQKNTFVRKGDQVTPGQPIAKVGKLIHIVNSMLHLELYNKTATGDLTVRNNETARSANGKPFMRRKDLIDPTPKLNEWKKKLPG